MHKKGVSDSVAAATEAMRRESGQIGRQLSAKIHVWRTVLAITTGAILFMLILTFAAVIRLLAWPLIGFAATVREDRPLNDKTGLSEVRLLARSYNDLRERRETLEQNLRTAAETDALTTMPNRYSFNAYIGDPRNASGHVTVFLFDVNGLKATNDTQGHLAGDALLRTAAACILDSFGARGGKCFRFGGDEFAAVVPGCTAADVPALLAAFDAAQHERGISIATGYACTADFAQDTYEKLFMQADQNMYAKKAAMKAHRE